MQTCTKMLSDLLVSKKTKLIFLAKEKAPFGAFLFVLVPGFSASLPSGL